MILSPEDAFEALERYRQANGEGFTTSFDDWRITPYEDVQVFTAAKVFSSVAYLVGPTQITTCMLTTDRVEDVYHQVFGAD